MIRLLDRAGELLLDVFALGLTAHIGIVLMGRALNSPTSHRLSTVPVVGPIVDSGRALIDQTYDPNTEG